MLSPEQIRRYREMSPEERYPLFLEMAAWAWKALDADGREMGDRRWDLIRRQHEEASRRLSEKFRQLP